MDKNDNIGLMATDKVTGFKGVITGFCQYMASSDTYLIAAKCEKSNESADSKWFDAGRLKITKGKKITL